MIPALYLQIKESDIQKCHRHSGGVTSSIRIKFQDNSKCIEVHHGPVHNREMDSSHQ